MKGKTSGARWFVNHASTNRVMFVCPAFVFWISLDIFGALSEVGLQDLRTGTRIVKRELSGRFYGDLGDCNCAARRRFLSRKATVKGPMPPGVGVTSLALPINEFSSRSPWTEFFKASP